MINPYNKKLHLKLTRAFSFAAISSLLLLASACESVGSIPAVANGKSVAFDYQQGYAEHDGRLSITMPNDEFFTGKFVQGSTAASTDGFEIGIDIESGDHDDTDTVVLEKTDTVSSLAEALLISQQGNTMSCRFQFSRPEDGIDGGGIGSCKVSDGRVVNATF